MLIAEVREDVRTGRRRTGISYLGIIRSWRDRMIALSIRRELVRVARDDTPALSEPRVGKRGIACGGIVGGGKGR